jgi:nucleoside-diphosphate-sugar epimerase
MAILLTGLTGEVGSALAPILQSKDKVFCLVRNGKSRVKNGKLNEILADQIIDGDIFDNKQCGISITDLSLLKKQEITKIIHAAASVKFDEHLSDEIWKTNFSGTKNILSVAKELGVRELHFMSTAYAPNGRNPYEKSKAAAEDLVKKSGLAYSVYRLSIVIGNSKTGHANGFNGYYGFLAGPHRLAERIRQKKGQNGKVQLPIYINCSFESTLNLVPVDWAVQILSTLINKPCQNDTYYIVHPDPPKVQWVMKQGFETLNIEGIKYNDYKKCQPEQEDRRLQIIQKAVNKELGRYRPYVTEEEKFCLKKTQQYLGTNYTNPPPITSQLLSILLKFAIEKNFKN